MYQESCGDHLGKQLSPMQTFLPNTSFAAKFSQRKCKMILPTGDTPGFILSIVTEPQINVFAQFKNGKLSFHMDFGCLLNMDGNDHKFGILLPPTAASNECKEQSALSGGVQRMGSRRSHLRLAPGNFVDV